MITIHMSGINSESTEMGWFEIGQEVRYQSVGSSHHVLACLATPQPWLPDRILFESQANTITQLF